MKSLLRGFFVTVVTVSALSIGGEGATAQVLGSPSIQVTSPNGGETFTKGQTVTITWNQSNVSNIGSIRLRSGTYVVLDITTSGLTVDPTSSTGSFEWKIPEDFCTTERDFSIEIFGGTPGLGNAVDQSDATFTLNPLTAYIKNVELAVISPNGGENFSPGDTVPIRFRYKNLDTAHITYYGNFSNDIDIAPEINLDPEQTEATYEWTVPGEPDYSSKYFKIRIWGVKKGCARNAYKADWVYPADQSDATFIITPKASFEFRPLGGYLAVNRPVDISWNQYGIDTVSLYLVSSPDSPPPFTKTIVENYSVKGENEGVWKRYGHYVFMPTADIEERNFKVKAVGYRNGQKVVEVISSDGMRIIEDPVEPPHNVSFEVLTYDEKNPEIKLTWESEDPTFYVARCVSVKDSYCEIPYVGGWISVGKTTQHEMILHEWGWHSIAAHSADSQKMRRTTILVRPGAKMPDKQVIQKKPITLPTISIEKKQFNEESKQPLVKASAIKSSASAQTLRKLTASQRYRLKHAKKVRPLLKSK